MEFTWHQPASLPMLTKLDQFIHHVPDLRAQMGHLWPDGMHIYSFWFIHLQNLHQPARFDIVLEQAAWHLAQARASDYGENHGFPVANLLRRPVESTAKKLPFKLSNSQWRSGVRCKRFQRS
ncbi:hypothetical protein EMIT0196MI5_120011 [Pseudomonas sp. IT-196MI5]